MLSLGPFRPDMADTIPGTLRGLLNASLKPEGDGVAYGPVRGVSNTFTHFFGPFTTPKGTLTCVSASGVYISFVMDATSIWRVQGDGDFTEVATGFSLPEGDRWGACQFGKYAIFTNTADGMLKYDIELGGSVTAISGAPRARGVAPVFDSVFAWDCNGDNKLFQNSSINEPLNWSGGTFGYQPVPDGEELLGIYEVSDGTALVFQRNAVRPLYRNDTISMFSMRKLVSNKGAINPWCIVPVNNGAFCIDTNGFQFVTAEGIQPIGRGKVNDWWLNDLRTDGLAKVQGAYDAEREVIRWLYPKTTDTDDYVYSACIDFDIGTGEFVPVEPALDTLLPSVIFTTASPGYTMEELDDFGDMDDLNGDMSLDDRFYFGGIPQLGAIIGVVTGDIWFFSYFNGPILEATFETSTQTLGRRTDILEVCPVTDAEDIEIEIGAKDKLSDDITYEDPATMDEDGIVPVYTAGRYIRLKATIPAGSDDWFFRGYEDLPGSSSVGGRG